MSALPGKFKRLAKPLSFFGQVLGKSLNHSHHQQRYFASAQSQTVCNWFCPELSRKYQDGSRFYEVDIQGENKLLPSVTSVLNMLNKPGLNQWAVNVTLNKLEETLSDISDVREDKMVVMSKNDVESTLKMAKGVQKDVLASSADLGTRAHDTIDRIVRGDTENLVIDEDVKQVVKNFWQWWNHSGVVLDPRGDSMIYSAKYGYAGAADALGVLPDGNLVVVDFKTSNGIFDTHIIQVAAYAKALEEQLIAIGNPPEKAKVKEAYVVRFSKFDDEYEVKRVANIDESFNAFKACLFLWHYKQKNQMIAV